MKNKFFAFLKNKRILSPIICVIFFAFALLLDQLTKGLIIPKLIPKVGDMLPVIPHFISFIFVKNKGAAWGILNNSTIFLTIISILGILIILAFYVLRVIKAGNRSSIFLAITIGLIVGGAIGNLIDRLAFGYVRDFINFDFINFPVFNFADATLTIGIILFLVYLIFIYSKETPNEPMFKKKDKNSNKNDEKSNKNDKKNENLSKNDNDNLKNDAKEVDDG